MQDVEPISDPLQRFDAPSRGLSLARVAGLCCGLFGIQIVWALQNANTSRIFQTLGANVGQLPMLWIAAPISGLLVQPIIGEWSDRTWGRWGRRRPFMAAGAVLAAIAMLIMPNAQTLWAASAALWLLTVSVNIVMEPFRALLADLLPEEKRDSGYALQVLFIGAGAVFASALPWAFTHWLGVESASGPAQVPTAVRAAFYVGAIGLLLTVFLSIATTRERAYPQHEGKRGARVMSAIVQQRGRLLRRGAIWVGGGVLLAVSSAIAGLPREAYLLAVVVGAFGGLHWFAAHAGIIGRGPLGSISAQIIGMPRLMRRLALVQFFTWFGLFALWVYAVPVVAGRYYGDAAPGSAAYNEAANWVGILFAAYNGTAAVLALALPLLVRRIGRRQSHALCLMAGGLGLFGFVVLGDLRWLWLPTLGIGCAWASILSTPYAMVASAVPPERMGVYMGIHNIFLVLPQLVAAAIFGPMVTHLFHGNAAGALAIAGAALLAAAACALTIPTPDHPGENR